MLKSTEIENQNFEEVRKAKNRRKNKGKKTTKTRGKIPKKKENRNLKTPEN